MESDLNTRRRHSIRLKGYDYSRVGAYFITICTHNRELLFGEIKTKMIIQKWWDKLPDKFPSIQIDQFIIMPNHIHGIIFITSVGADPSVCPNQGQSHRIAPTLATAVQWFKTMTTNDYIKVCRSRNTKLFQKKLWQRNYYEHIIRNETDLSSIRQYITDNPAKWDEDEENPSNADMYLTTQSLLKRKEKVG